MHAARGLERFADLARPEGECDAGDRFGDGTVSGEGSEVASGLSAGAVRVLAGCVVKADFAGQQVFADLLELAFGYLPVSRLAVSRRCL